MTTRLNNYIDGILNGSTPAGELIVKAVQRHVNDLDRMGNADFPYHFDIAEAEKHIKFAEICRHWKGAKAKKRIILEPHQVFFWAQLYGWRHNTRNIKRFHRYFKLVSRKNYKTTEAAVMALDHLLIDRPAGAQIYAGATKNEQAMIVVNDAGKIIQVTPELSDMFTLFKYRDKISRVVTKDMDSFFATLSKESKMSTQDGLDPSYGIVEEHHAHVDDGIYNIIESGMGNRADWLIGIISTAGSNKQGPCYSVMRDLGIKVLNGILEDDETLFLIHEMDEDDDWNSESNWVKSNPRMEADPDFLEYLRTRYKMAKNQGGEKASDFKTKNLNLWIDQYDTWIPDELFMACAVKGSAESLYGFDAWGGLDLASTRDFNSLVLDVVKDGRHYLVPYFWIPQIALEKRLERVDVDLRRWKEQGFIRVIPGSSIDYDFMVRDILEISKQFNIRSIGIDPRNENAIRPKLDIKMGGFVTMSTFAQDMASMSYPTKVFEKMIVDKQIAHFHNPVLRWMLSNVAVYSDANENIKLVKNKSTDKIDGIVSSVMAIGEWLTEQMGTTRSVYEDRGVLSIPKL